MNSAHRHARGVVGAWVDRAVALARGEPRKAAALAVLLAVLGAVSAKLYLLDGVTPVAARAGISDSATSQSNPARAGSRPVSATRQLLEWTRQPVIPTTRNLFALDLERFRRDTAAAVPDVRPEGPQDGFWEQVEKSMAARADQEKAREIFVENVRLAASRLELQSTVMSEGSPKALVNGTLVREGETVDGFKVVRIEAKRIIVEREGVRLEVSFKF
jgi:hypothetical protein